PDGRTLVTLARQSGEVALWETGGGRKLRTLDGLANRSWVALSPDGKLVAAGSVDQGIRLWDAATGAARAGLRGHASAVLCLAFAPDGATLYSGGEDRAVRAWDVAEGRALTTLATMPDRVFGIHPSPDGDTLAVSVSTGLEEGTLHLVDRLTGHRREV